MRTHRRDWLRGLIAGAVASPFSGQLLGAESMPSNPPLRITGLKITPVALPDPPLLAASGCHGPYFLRNIIELEVEGGITGISEMPGSAAVTASLEKTKDLILGKNAFAYRTFSRELLALGQACYAGIELACLDACGRATGRRLCELVGGPVRESVEFAAYLFFRYAADHPVILSDPHLVDSRGKGPKALDDWGEVRTPETMADMAKRFQDQWGFRVFKLKAGVLTPEVERDALKVMSDKLGPNALVRIDPNCRWKPETAIRIGKEIAGLPLEYYEDPVRGCEPMSIVRKATGLKMSTNTCVTSFSHLPEAFQFRPIDVLLCDHHYFGGFAGCQALGPIADAAGWILSQHSNNHAGISMAAMIHLAASIPQLTMASDTHYPWLVDDADIIEGPKLTIKDGRMVVPSGPGLGVNLDRDRLARAHEVYRKCGMRARDDASLMRRLEPGWNNGPL